MTSIKCEVIYEGCRKQVKFKRNKKLTDIKEEIRRSFDTKRPREHFHLVLFKNGREYDINNDNDVKLLDSGPIERVVRGASAAFGGDSHPLEIQVYSGGPFSIWLRDEEHSITNVPASDGYLMHIAREATFPDFRKKKFEYELHKLMRSIKLANYSIISSHNRRLEIAVLNMGTDDLIPAINHCTRTFCVVRDRSNVALVRITTVVTHLRDGLERLVQPLLVDINAQAVTIETESQQCITILTTLDGKVREFRRMVEEALIHEDEADRRAEIIGYLDETLSAIRKVQRVINDVKDFWTDVRGAIRDIGRSPLMADISGAVAAPAARSEEEDRRRARHLWRTKKFKLNGIAFISKHAAIRDICVDCIDPMNELERKLHMFFEEDSRVSPEVARRKCTELKAEESQATSRPVGGEQRIVIDGEMDDGTVAEFKVALGVPYVNTLREITVEPVQETGEADFPLSTQVQEFRNEREYDDDNLANFGNLAILPRQ